MTLSQSKLVALVFFGVFVHLVLLYSIFDIYYSSPLVRGAKVFPITYDKGPASRLVFISADGLRSRSFFEHPEKSPFLHGLIRQGKAAWGVLQGHVPTESRPGHVALMAGFYEDVSAVARGWRHNPVEFDSIINQSTNVWLWGGEDITELFADAKGSHLVHRESYSRAEENFAGVDAHNLDNWVFDNVERYFSKRNSVEKIFAEKSFFFLHLLGIDINGHGFKPTSEKYKNNIRVVDSGIQRMTELFHRIYNDSRTVFVFTADHGMTNWGAHGSGTDDEIFVPFVVWGAGVRPSVIKHSALNQVDFAPLQAALLGTAIPANSVGVLPISLLDASPKYRFKAAYSNLRQMIEQYSIRRQERIIHSLPWMFQDYSGFRVDALAKVDAEIHRLADLRRFDAAAAACVEWIPRVRDALLYFHRYKRFSLGLAITMLYISWNFLVYSLVVSRTRRENRSGEFGSPSRINNCWDSIFLPNRKFSFCLIMGILLIVYQRLPLANYFYYLMPIFTLSVTWNLNFPKREADSTSSNSEASTFFERVENLLNIFFGKHLVVNLLSLKYYLITAGFGATFSAVILTVFVGVFYERAILSIGYICLSPVWFLSKLTNKDGDNIFNRDLRKWKFIWLLCCLTMSIFPLMETVGGTQHPILVIMAPLIGAALLVANCKYLVKEKINRTLSWICKLYVTASCLLFANVNFSNHYLALLTGCFSWSTLVVSVLLPFCDADSRISGRVIVWMASLYLPYVMMSIAYESIFLLVFCVFLFTLFRLELDELNDAQFFALNLRGTATNCANESSLCHGSSREFGDKRRDILGHFSWREWRRAVLLVAVVEMAFFGTGNIASLNSFNTDSIQKFVTVFSPFLMTALLVAKMALPFLQMGFAFSAILLRQGADFLPRLGALMMFITDAMAVIFFYNLKDDGSWLEIGMSIGNYVICAVSSIVVFILLHVANIVIRFNHQTRDGENVLVSAARPKRSSKLF